MTIVGYFDPAVPTKKGQVDCSFCSLTPENLRMKKGGELIEKYKDLFCSKKIKIKKCKNFVDNKLICFLFINVESFNGIVEDHLSDFKTILGDEITTELLLEQVLEDENVFENVLKNHQGLIGTLLGYGRNNAWLFHQREKGYLFNGLDSLVGGHSFSIKRPSRFMAEDEIEKIDLKLEVFDDRGILDFNPLLMSLPSFVADKNTAETIELKADYQSQYRNIVHRYENQDFLEVTVKRIASL